MKRYGFILCIFFLISSNGQIKAQLGNLPLNEIQVIGSHNSYKEAIYPRLWNLIDLFEPKLAYSLQYEHIPLDKQLELGLRNLELDVYLDPKGGRYEHPLGIKIMNIFSAAHPAYDTANDLLKPGLKVFHNPDFDFRSHNLLFKDCLRIIKKWSDNNKEHLPVIITINAKDDTLKIPGTIAPLPFTRSSLKTIDAEILSVFDDKDLITPDFVRGNYKTLEEAILKKGWPKINEVRGRFLFVLDEKGRKLKDYLNPDKSLSGKVMFVNIKEGNPSAAVRIINDPIKNENHIRELVKKGYIVRTRADSDTKEARENNYERFKKAIESGAQVITTDYYLPSKLFKSNYHVIFKNNRFFQADSFLVNYKN